MAKKKQLNTRQLNVIEDLFSEELDEQAVLDKHNVGRHLYAKWLADETFAEHLEKRIAASYRQIAAYIARHARLAATKLVELTESDKHETARKACLDIIAMPAAGGNLSSRDAATGKKDAPATNALPLTPKTAGKLLDVLAEQNNE
ncbi:MAG: hypothetical protein JW715_02045 [Sedimentisphaerales bacterium]|nr:hypothetical protein [Sedimentisphaerales bacterium]